MQNWVSIAEMARFLGLSLAQFRALNDRMGRPCTRKRGQSKTSQLEIDSIGWLSTWTAGPGDAERHHARLLKARADSAELELAVRQGRTLTVEDHTSFIMRFAGAVREAAELSCETCQKRYAEALEEFQEHEASASGVQHEPGDRGGTQRGDVSGSRASTGITATVGSGDATEGVHRSNGRKRR